MKKKTVVPSQKQAEFDQNFTQKESMTMNVKVNYTQEELNEYPLLPKIEVGMAVVALPDSDYEGLGGVVTDILYGEARETENETILDIVVDFEEHAPLEKTHPHLNGTGIGGVMMGEDELAFVFDVEGTYLTAKGQLYCDECSELKTKIVEEKTETSTWVWTDKGYVQTVEHGVGLKHFKGCEHEVRGADAYLPVTPRYQTEPMTEEEMRANQDDAGYISGVVAVSLSDLIEGDRDNFLDYISEKLTGSPLLMNIDFKVVGGVPENEDLVLIEVVGDASGIIEAEYE